MGKTWCIADTHFGHEKIIAYESRPCSSVAEMDSMLIRNWNATVGDDDKVFFLGDFAFASAGRIQEILRVLRGYKVMVLGNHDRDRSVSWWLEAGFAEVSAYPIVVDEFFILSHEPMYISTNMPYANIFGHVHSNPMYATVTPQSFCVCAERINFTPIDFEEVKERIRQAGGQG